MPIASIEIRLFAHATEDPNKVTDAVKKIFPIDCADEVEFERTNLKGHYGNPISLFQTKVKEEKKIEAFVDNFFSRINTIDKENLVKDIGLHVEKRSLYLRIDKQAASYGEIRLCTRDPIRVRIRFKKKGTEEILKACKEFGML